MVLSGPSGTRTSRCALPNLWFTVPTHGRIFPRCFPHLWIASVESGGLVQETAEALWQSALHRIRSGVLSPGAKPWIEGTRAIRIAGDTMVLAVPSAFAKKWLEDHYAGALADALGDSAGRPLALHVTVDPARVGPIVVEPAPAPAPAAELPRRSAVSTPLNPKYTFDTFVIGPSNRF